MSDDFHGLPTRSLDNGHFRLDVLAEAGPRIVRAVLAGTDTNLLAELPDKTEPTPHGTYHFFGGHRLWTSPEANPRSYMPDHEPIELQEAAGVLKLAQPADEVTHIRKELEIALAPDRAAATLTHRLRNEGVWPVELAPWALTMLPLGGKAYLPQGNPASAPNGLLPDRTLVLWPYTTWSDPRPHWDDSMLVLHAEPRLPPFKIGYFNHHGWIAYLNAGALFIKRFGMSLYGIHPDFGCNVETFVNHEFIEMETLGPLTLLDPGEAIEHAEEWEFAPAEGATDDTVRDLLSRFGLAGGR